MKPSAYPIFTTVLVLFFACGGSGGEGGETARAPETEHRLPIEHVTFAVFGNTGADTDDGRTFEALIDAVNGTDVDFAVDLGNCLPPDTPPAGVEALWGEIDGARRRFTVPVYPAAGPLDVFDGVSDRAYSDRYGPHWYGFTRGGIRFLVLDTGDGAYRYQFGNLPRIGDDQAAWLLDELGASPAGMPVVILMNRPLWDEAPSVWRERLAPLLKTGSVALVISLSGRGLFDWGDIDGIRAVSTGCTGPSAETGPGLFPHALLVSMDGGGYAFSVLTPDGAVREGIRGTGPSPVFWDDTADRLAIPPLKTDNAWNVSETFSITLSNQEETPFTGMLDFIVFRSTSWDIRPSSLPFTVNPGERTTYHLRIEGRAPALGPLPRLRTVVAVGERTVVDRETSLTLTIPKPRTGEVITSDVRFADTIPYEFDGSPLTVPFDIVNRDSCGRLILFRERGGAIPECLYVSPLADFISGINRFTWDGRDMNGDPVPPGDIAAYLFVYNKDAPVTWVADGPPEPGGSFSVSRGLAGIQVETHTNSAIVTYPIDASLTAPSPSTTVAFDGVLWGLPLTGFCRGEDGRIYLGTDLGITCLIMRQGAAVHDRSFGDGGYVRLSEWRGREPGAPVSLGGRLYVGFGGGRGGAPGILILDGFSGDILEFIDLGAFYPGFAEPPALSVTDRGIWCAHPRDGTVIRFAPDGRLLWTDESGETAIGERDEDGLSFTYGIGTDRYGFSYVCSPGTTARCGVLGPDGRGLFRVILVQLPGLRASGAIPFVEGRETDGLYLVTRGGDRPYVFHVPFTIRRGTILPASGTMEEPAAGE